MNRVYEVRQSLESIERLRASIADELSFTSKKQHLCNELLLRAESLAADLPETVIYPCLNLELAITDFVDALNDEDTFCDEDFDLLFYELYRPIPQQKFTEREFKGSCLDLKALFEEYSQFTNNINETIDYSTFITFLPKILADSSFNFSIAKNLRNSHYTQFLQNLESYLASFYSRTHPLEPIDFTSYKFGLKEVTDELYCDICKKLFANQNVFDHHLLGKIHKKKTANYVDDGDLTHRALVYLANLSNELENTAELCDLDFEDEGDVSMKTEQNIEENLLDIPLSWNGRPIPFWLFKLYGLDKKFVCEICNGEVYRGRKDFLKHFSESRHTAALKSLGITNSEAFSGITSTADALALAEKLAKHAFI